MAEARLSVGTVLRFYHDEAVPALASALIIDDNFPQEVLNEIRHAFTHLAHASTLADGQEEAEADELKAAMQHLRRVCYDSYKVCILVTATRAEAAIEALTEDLQLPANVYSDMSALRERRMELSADEAKKPGDGAIDALKVLFDDYDRFYISLEKSFQGETADMRREARAKREARARRKGWVDGMVIGLVGGVAVTVAVWLVQNYFHWLLPPG